MALGGIWSPALILKIVGVSGSAGALSSLTFFNPTLDNSESTLVSELPAGNSGRKDMGWYGEFIPFNDYHHLS